MTARLATHAWVGALVRRVNAAGDFATIVRKGDAVAGAVLLLWRRRDGSCAILSKTNRGAGESVWIVQVDEPSDRAETVNNFLAKQQRYDPDLWIVELDTAAVERFIDEPIVDG